MIFVSSMKLSHIAGIRLSQQAITDGSFNTPQSVVQWMGAMQAQDYAMAKWAVALRMNNATDKEIDDALNNGEILRTHVLRPTWHFVSPRDIRWMVELTGSRIMASMKGRHKALGLTDRLLAKSNDIIQKALAEGEHLTREELLAHLVKAKFQLNEYRSLHYLMWAELSCIICNGKRKGIKQTYALLDNRAPKAKSLSKEEALANLASLYFTSHGPATVQDFTWWSGLMAGDARHALEMVKKGLASEKIGEQTFWFARDAVITKSKKTAYLLPAFDEFIISYRDRSASLNVEHNRKSITINGIFKPTVVLNGQVTGLWKRTMKKDKVVIETEFFHKHSAPDTKMIKKCAEDYGRFLEKEVEIR
jgi:hypothetical protein